MEATLQPLDDRADARLVREVRLMRTAQQKYFRTRSKTALDEARYHEATVDKLLREQPTPEQPQQAQLFSSTP